MRRPHALLLLALLATADAGIAQGLAPLEREWCTGFMPASWGFAVTPSEACVEVHVRVRSPAVLLTSAKPGPGMPEGWTVEKIESREAVARGATPLAAGATLATFLLIETNRGTAALEPRGASPVEWDIWFVDAAGKETASGRMNASFPPVLPLAEAVNRGIVLLSVEGHGPTGPVEITVDNPTWQPLWLDVETGSTLSATGREWVIGPCAPFRMMRRQKTGRTVTAFPLQPSGDGTTPRRLGLGKPRASDPTSTSLLGLAVAAEQLQDQARSSARQPAGPFERASPWDFWPLALRWATWQATSQPAPAVLAEQVAALLDKNGHAGDPVALALDRAAATAEVETAAAAIAARATELAAHPLPLELLAARERFR